jgi:thiol-disulfide isomerase/thioredoxin
MKLRNLLIVALATLLFACTNTNPKQVIISGTITNPKGDVVEFRMKDTTYSTTLNKDNTFSISIDIDSAVYLSFYHGQESSAMYLNGGENVNITIDTDLFDETITYEGSIESSFLAIKYLLEEKGNFYDDLFSTPKDEYIANLDLFKTEGFALIETLENKNFAESEKKDMDRMYQFFSEKIDAVANMPKIGEPAIDFTYHDKDGNELSLSTFNGSLVYVDVWATWCGPCKTEIPALKQLEIDYHNNNITFLSVSVDTDKEAWLKMLDNKQLGGVQLWADGWSKITKDYAIFGIPRFMLFDVEGNVISTNAPRPSSDDIRELLDANL